MRRVAVVADVASGSADAHPQMYILTQLAQLERVGRVDDIDKGLQLEAARRHVYVVIEHGEFECRLYLVGALLEYGTCEGGGGLEGYIAKR